MHRFSKTPNREEIEFSMGSVFTLGKNASHSSQGLQVCHFLEVKLPATSVGIYYYFCMCLCAHMFVHVDAHVLVCVPVNVKYLLPLF